MKHTTLYAWALLTASLIASIPTVAQQFGPWSAPVNLGPTINTTLYFEQGPPNQATRLAMKSRVDSRLLRVCCGELIAPRLAEMRQPDGPMIFVAVWHCPKCHRWTA